MKISNRHDVPKVSSPETAVEEVYQESVLHPLPERTDFTHNDQIVACDIARMGVVSGLF